MPGYATASMLHAVSQGRPVLGMMTVDAAAITADAAASDTGELRFRQLRHHTKNALQTILNIVDGAPELRGTCAGASLSVQLQTRILLAAQLSDTLFGMTRAPGVSFAERLTRLCEGVVSLLGDRDAETTVSVSVGECPAAHESAVLRVANELVGNAVKHGMHARLLGRIAVSVGVKRGRLVLSVVDNGWGCGPEPLEPGEGLTLAALLARRAGGTVRVRELRGRTVATMELPL